MTNTAGWHDAIVNLAAHPVGWSLARLARRLPPVFSVPGFGVVVNDAEFAHQVLVRDDLFIKNGEGSLSSIMTELLGPFALGNMDGEAHACLRGRLADVVAPSQASELLRACDAPLEEVYAALKRGETVDLVQSMRWMSGRITFDMLGVTPQGRDERAACIELVALGERIASGFDFRRPSATRLSRVRADCERLAGYARVGYESDDAPPRSFVRRLRDLGLTFEEARGVLSLIFLAGTLTTAAALPRILALLIDSRQFDALRTAPEAIPLAVSEGLRFTTPVPATMRIAQQDTSVMDRRIKRGTRMVVLTCNLARDPSVFEHPDRFIANRRQPQRSRNLWFGAGAHFCLGFAIAQRQLQMVLQGLASLNGALRIVRRSAARGVIIPAYARLEIALDPTRA